MALWHSASLHCSLHVSVGVDGFSCSTGSMPSRVPHSNKQWVLNCQLAFCLYCASKKVSQRHGLYLCLGVSSTWAVCMTPCSLNSEKHGLFQPLCGLKHSILHPGVGLWLPTVPVWRSAQGQKGIGHRLCPDGCEPELSCWQCELTVAITHWSWAVLLYSLLEKKTNTSSWVQQKVHAIYSIWPSRTNNLFLFWPLSCNC